MSNANQTEPRVFKVGTIQRHPMPVEQYLLGTETEVGQRGYDHAYRCANQLGWQLRFEQGITKVELYYTGLTEVTIGAVDGFESMGIEVTLMRYDKNLDAYFPIQRNPLRHEFMQNTMRGDFNARIIDNMTREEE